LKSATASVSDWYRLASGYLMQPQQIEAKLFSTEVACHANGTGPVRPVPMPRKRYGDRTGLSWPQNDEAAN
jgi:hypothetical protein